MGKSIDMTEGESDYLKYKFKQYLGSVSREIQNRRLKEQEMGMIIIKNYSMPHNCYACDLHNYHECDLTTESIEEDYCWNGDSREKHCPLREVEAIPKADYENRLKEDLKAILVELQFELDEMKIIKVRSAGFAPYSKDPFRRGVNCSKEIIQEHINVLKGEKS